jgi:hypothetical protein
MNEEFLLDLKGQLTGPSSPDAMDGKDSTKSQSWFALVEEPPSSDYEGGNILIIGKAEGPRQLLTRYILNYKNTKGGYPKWYVDEKPVYVLILDGGQVVSGNTCPGPIFYQMKLPKREEPKKEESGNSN